MPDEDLIEAMSLALSAESEQAKKFTQGKSVKQTATKASKLEAKANSEVYPRNCTPTNDAKANSVTRKDAICRPRNPYPRECKACIGNNHLDCFHCFTCGGLNHRARYCRSGNGQRLPPRDREKKTRPAVVIVVKKKKKM